MTEEIREFIIYLHENKRSSANTEASYRRDLQKAADYRCAQNYRYQYPILSSVPGKTAVGGIHCVQKRIFFAYIFSVSVQNQKDRRGSVRKTSSAESGKEDAGHFNNGASRKIDGTTKR